MANWLSTRFDILIATSAMDHPFSLYDRYLWLREQLPFISDRNYIFCVPPENLILRLLTPSDVIGAGWFAAKAANVKPGATVAVVGDGDNAWDGSSDRCDIIRDLDLTMGDRLPHYGGASKTYYPTLAQVSDFHNPEHSCLAY